jgi:hypothetical protein
LWQLWCLFCAFSCTYIYSRKVTGGDATVVLQAILNSVSQDDAYVIERIIDKTLKLVWTLGLIK